MKRTSLIILLLLAVFSLHAEIITLHSGKTIRGEILVKTDEVIIIRDQNGARHQYPTSDVEKIQEETISSAKNASEPTEENVNKISGEKKTAMILELAGGGTHQQGTLWGGSMSADLVIGSRYIRSLDRHIVLGGSVGFTGAFMGEKHNYMFLPIQFAARIPLLEKTQHTPVLGASLGYGIALSKQYRGGLHAGIDIAYGYRTPNKGLITIGANVRFQQAEMQVTDTFEDSQYSQTAGRNMVSIGVKLGVMF